MDILILTPGLGASDRAERYAIEVASRLHPASRVRVVTSEDGESDGDHPFEVIRVGTGTAGFVTRAAVVVRRSVATDGFRTALATSWHGALAALVGRPGDGGLRVHVVVHGPELHVNPVPGSGTETFRRLRTYVLGRVDAFHPVSRSAAREIAALGVPESRIATVEIGVDPHRFAPVDGFPLRRRLGVGSRPMILSTAGSTAETALAALPEILSEHPGAVLVIHGSGASGQASRADRAGVRDAVRFVDAVPDGDLCALYSAADVFVHAPGRDAPDAEQDGSLVLRAGACGVPMIGSRTGDIPDAVRDGVTGLLVPPGSAESLSAAVLFFLNDRGAAEDFGIAARNHVLERANWDTVTRKLAASMATS